MIIMICMCKVIRYYQQIYLKTFKCIETYEFNPTQILFASALSLQPFLKMTAVKLKSLTNIDMLQRVEERTRGGAYHLIHPYAQASNKYMKNCLGLMRALKEIIMNHGTITKIRVTFKKIPL